jgi:hypothetical protein
VIDKGRGGYQMNQVPLTISKPAQDNRILSLTRWVAGLVIPVLLLAFAILFFLPEETGTRFAWQIRPPMMSMFIGAGYLGGAYFFARVATGRRWHRVAAGFLPVTAFTWSMLAATILHWDRFSHGRLGFQLWLILYIITPLLVPWLWWRNRTVDPGTPETGDIVVPVAIRWLTGLIGALFLAATLLFFLWPSVAIGIWPWNLTPLTARVMAGWIALMGVGAATVSQDRRWSAWRIEIESIVLWQVLVLVGAVLNLDDFSNPLNWYLAATVAGLIGAVTIYAGLETRHRAAMNRA